MPSATYSFLDIAVLDAVRQRFAAGDALALISTELNEVIWANGPGAALFGYADIAAAIGAPTRLSMIARRQIMATPGYPEIGNDRSVAVRIASGAGSKAISFAASSIRLPDGQRAILLAAPHRSGKNVISNAITGFDEAGHAAALVNEEGIVVAATDGLPRLGIAAETLVGMVKEIAGQPDRLVKRMIPSKRGMLPAGFARLTDDPALHLLVAVDDGVDEAEPMVEAAPDRETDGEEVGALEGELGDSSETSSDEVNSGTAEPERRERWYFNTDETQHEATAQDTEATEPGASARDSEVPAADPTDAPEPPTNAASEPTLGEEVASVPAADFQRALNPVRFVWRTDADGKFSAMSPELASAVGPGSADVVGQTFREVDARLKLDPSGEIAKLLERRDTWSGRTVLWPVAGSDLRVPVDLAALPVYGRQRNFEGFRGFGVARGGDAVNTEKPVEPETSLPPAADASVSEPGIEPEAISDALPKSDDPFKGEVPALKIVSGQEERRYSDKVIRLAEHRTPNASEKGLSPVERNAFREIGDRLKKVVTTPRESGTEGSGSPDAPADEVSLAAPVVNDTASNSPDSSAEPEANEAQEPIAQGDNVADAASQDGEATVDESSAAPGRDASTPDGSDTTGTGRIFAEQEDIAGHESIDETGEIEAAVDSWSRGASETPAASNKEEPTDDGHASGDFEQGDIKAAWPVGFVPSALSQFGESGPLGEPTGEPALREDTGMGILARLPVPVLIHAGDKLHFGNEEFFELTGYGSLDELADNGGLEVLFGEPYPLASDGDGDQKLRLITRDQKEIPVTARLQSVPWQGGKALLLALSPVEFLEPSEHTPAVAKLSASPSPPSSAELERRIAEMHAIVDTATDGVVVLDQQGLIRSISRAAEALFGFESDDVVGRPFASLFAIESQRAAKDYLAGLSEHGVASVLNDGLEVIGREAEGRFIPLFMTIGRLPNESGYCAVVRDITQWKRAEEELTQARAQAERASSQKTDFLARVSHEIRTPLNAIIGFSELMIDEKFGPIGNDRYRDYLRDINRSGNHVLDLVNDLLDISKIEAGEQEMAYEAVSLNETLAEAVAMMQPQANRERVIIRSSFASQLPEVVADLRSVRQIAINLLSNAVRYTQAGGQVIVSTAYEPSGDIVMRVRDTGVGMSSAEIEQALKPFKQINALKRGRGEGTGLGLPLTKAMVEANRARFSILSTPGEGTLVEVTFPSTRVLAD